MKVSAADAQLLVEALECAQQYLLNHADLLESRRPFPPSRTAIDRFRDRASDFYLLRKRLESRLTRP